MALGLTLLFALPGTCGRAQQATLPPIIPFNGRSRPLGGGRSKANKLVPEQDSRSH